MINFLSSGVLETWHFALIGAGGGIVLIGLILIILAVSKKRGALQKKRTEDVRIKNGVRYTKSDAVENDDGSMRVSHAEDDVILTRGREYTVQKGGEIMPGKYTVLSADQGVGECNIRHGGYVRSVAHNTPIILSEGDKICSVSHTVILR